MSDKDVSEPCKFPGSEFCGQRPGYRRGCRSTDCCEGEKRYRHELYLMGRIKDPTIPRRNSKQLPNEWMQDGLCVDVDPEEFEFIIDGGRGVEVTPLTKQMTRKYCGECPVRAQCLQYGLKTKSMGIWGGSLLTWQPRKRVVNLLG